jgi:hypothetical protein
MDDQASCPDVNAKEKQGLCLAGLALLALILTAGCDQAAFNRRVEHRQTRLAAQIGSIERAENERPRKLSAAFQELERQCVARGDRFESSADWYAGMAREDKERFERRLPGYNEVVLDLLEGDVERARWTASTALP